MAAADEELFYAGAARQAEMVRNSELSATELVGAHLDRIERLEPQLNAVPGRAPRAGPGRGAAGGGEAEGRARSGPCSGSRSR